jgi:hypothetical protein
VRREHPGELIAGALQWVGAPDPMRCKPAQQGEESPDKTAHRVLAREWASLCRALSAPSLTAKAVLAHLYPKERAEAGDPRWDELRGVVEHFAPPRPGTAPDHATLGKVLRKLKHAPVRASDAGPLRRFAIDGKTHGRMRRRVEDVPGRRVEGDAAPE